MQGFIIRKKKIYKTAVISCCNIRPQKEKSNWCWTDPIGVYQMLINIDDKVFSISLVYKQGNS